VGGVELSEKSDVTTSVAVAVWLNEPLAPVMVSV
jgi:hypothetical protein